MKLVIESIDIDIDRKPAKLIKLVAWVHQPFWFSRIFSLFLFFSFGK